MTVLTQVRRVPGLLPVMLVGVIIAGLVGTTMVSANARPAECAASGSSLGEARNAYGTACSLPRVDCDEVDDIWYCSSRVIGSAAPGNVTVDEVGASDIGAGGTTLVVTTPPNSPTTVTVPSTQPSTVDPTTTQTTSQVPNPAPAPDPGAVTRTYPKNDGPERNPLKGWNSGWSDDRPEATVGFQYIKWSDLEPRNGYFDFEAVEDVIARSGSKDRHVILRLYCDWWGANEESRGCPDWMYSEVGVERIRGDNGKYITDYNDPRYLEQAEQAIAALGARYDDDPRIYAFQLGIIGYWGEWHTWGSQVDGSSYEITQATESRILAAYRNSFDRVRLMARYPDRSILVGADDIGFHNDYFRPDNGHSAEFDDAVAEGQRWVGGPIGGEAPPGLSSGDYDALYATSQGLDMIETGHYSTMKPGSVSAQHRASHLELHKRFGYNFQIDRAQFAATLPSDGRTTVELSARNIGVAPFYYDWEVQFALLGADGQPVVVSEAAAYDLRNHLPGDSFTLAGSLPVSALSDGDYRVAVRILQPGADANKTVRWKLDARNTYVLFANDMPVIDGSWNSQNQLDGGWQVLGTTATR